jgi:hypothetical protein
MSEMILFSQMSPPEGEREAFERWYDEDHIAARMSIPGFTRARRYWETSQLGEPADNHLAVYELDSQTVETEPYRRLKADPGARTEDFLARVTGFTRFTADKISDAGTGGAIGRYLSVVAFAVPEEHEAQFDAWYTGEHVPLLLEADDWLRVHRYRVVSGEGGPWTHLALHELGSLEVMDSPERARARSGPARDALADLPWFAGSGRWLYQLRTSHQARQGS